MRILLKLVFVIVFIGIASIVALTFSFDINDYKNDIANAFSKTTGRSLVFEGDIDLSVFPWLGLELGSLSLGNAEGFSTKHFAHVNTAHVRIKLLPLLQKRLEIDTIIIDGLTLNLERNKDGKTNWSSSTDDALHDSATGDSSEDAISDKTMPSPLSSDIMSALASISIAGVRIYDANINWSDDSKGTSYQLKNVNFNILAILPHAPSAISMSTEFNSKNLAVSGRADLNANVMIDSHNQQQYRISGLNITAEAADDALPFSSVTVSLKSNLAVDSNRKHISLQLFELVAEVVDKSLPNGKLALEAKANATIDIKQQQVAITDLAIELHDIIVNGDIKAIEIDTDKPRFSGQIITSTVSLKKLADDFAVTLLPANDKSAFESIQLSSTFSGSPEHIDITKLQLLLDQSKLQGQFSVTDFTKPAIKFDLALDKIDIDRYLPPDVSKQEGEAAIALPATATASGVDRLPLTALRQLDINGSIDIGQLNIMGAYGKNILVTIKGADGLIALSPLSADIYQGQYQGNISLNAQSDTLKLSLNETLKNVQLGPLLASLYGNNIISGTADAEIKLTAHGITAQQIKRTLNGHGQFSLKNGRLAGISIVDAIAKEKNPESRATTPSNTQIGTDFASLAGSLVITDGIVHNQNLQLLSPLLRVDGDGVINLPEENMHYSLNAIVDTERQISKKLSGLSGLNIPVVISGSFDNPKVRVDLASLVEQNAKTQAKKRINDTLRGKLGDDLGTLLGKTLGIDSSNADSNAPEEAEKSLQDKAKDALKKKLRTFF